MCDRGDDGSPQLDPMCELYRTGDPDGRTMSALNRWMMPMGGIVIGIGTIMFQNYFVRRPIYSSIHRYFLYSALGAGAGEWAHRYRLKVTAERDLQYYHYMTLHPEDFPPPKKILFRDYIEPWMPIR